ncbi:MAG TPA: ATP-binding protein [Terriglobales bacterium]|nr:ATP-binding protein [Terriglobales bacterium]
MDDEKNVLTTIQAILQEDGFEVDAADDGALAIEAIRARHYDLVLTDLKMPGIDGLGVLAEARKCSPNTVTMLMTGYGSLPSALEAVQLGAYDYLLKPMEVPELKQAVKRGLERGKLSEIDTLYRISQALSGTIDPAEITAEIADATRRVLRLEYASLIVVGAEDAENKLTSVLSSPPIEAKLRSGQIVTLSEGDHTFCEWASTRNIVSAAIVPGRLKGALICALLAHNASAPFEFHASVRRFMRGLAEQAALAVNNTRLFEELKQNNEQLQSANQRLRELDQLKSRFLRMATHELRTPLTLILGYNSMLADSSHERLSEDERLMLSEAIHSSRRLIHLVNSMLDINRIEAGKMQLRLSPCNLVKTLERVVALFQTEAQKKGIHLGLQLPSRLISAVVDGERIEQVIINLIANALKFTDSGGSVVVSLDSLRGEAGFEVAVRDTGIGIPEGQQSQIFEEFARLEGPGSQKHEGSGLGLAIAKRIVEAHAGNISVTSNVGHGSTFRFRIPTTLAGAETGEAVPA